MFDIPRLYITACSNSVSLVPLHPIVISIFFHHYKELMELKAQVEQIIGDNNNNRVREDVAPPTNSGTFDSYSMINNRLWTYTPPKNGELIIVPV
jgi:hypothetical protein